MKIDTKQSKLCILKLFIDYRIVGGKNEETLDIYGLGYYWSPLETEQKMQI